MPRMKLGAFYDMANNILDTADREGWNQEQDPDQDADGLGFDRQPLSAKWSMTISSGIRRCATS